jgi:acetyl-CoA synthetase
MMKKFSSTSYEEFVHEFTVNVPENFNFAFDVLDAIADEEPQRLAMVHVDDAGVRNDYSFAWFQEQSAKLAGALETQGLKKGDRVMLILYRRVEFWVSMLACHRLGLVPVPSPSQLTVKILISVFAALTFAV